MELQINPEFRALIPPLEPSEYQALEESIRGEGIRDNITICKGVIIDGHNRYEIAKKLNITEIPVKEKEFANTEEIKIWIKKIQLARRNLALFRKAEYLMDISEWEEKRKQASANQLGGTSVPIDTKVDRAKDLATKLKIGRSTASHIIQIHDKASEKIKAKCRSGEMSINEAYQETKKSEQEFEPPEIDIAPPSINLPSGKYQTIVIDPTWSKNKSKKSTQESTNYPVLTADQIRKLPIKDIADPNCHVYLWASHEYLLDAFIIFKTWKVKFHCLLTWVKNTGPTPVGWTFSTEHCLFGVMGDFESIKKGVRVDFSADAIDQSPKPERFYEIVKEVSPEPRIVLFGKESHEGFVDRNVGSETTKDLPNLQNPNASNEQKD